MHRLCIAIVTAITISSVACTASNSTRLTAQEILRKTTQTYASCESYQDTGTVNVVSKSSKQIYRSTLRFETVFTRPNHFRFEYNIGKDSVLGPVRHVIWISKDKAYWWWTIEPKVIKEDTLDMAIASATGVSSMSAINIPQLLMPGKLSGWKITDLKSLKLLDSEKVDGVDCFKIKGTGNRDSKVILWITKQNYLIRKIMLRFKKDDFVFTTLYKPVINPTLPLHVFESRVRK